MKLYARGALDPRWTTHHNPVVASFMLATIKVIRKLPSTTNAPPVYDPDTKTWTGGTFNIILENVQARVQPYGIIGDQVVGQDTTGRRLMRVQIDDLSTGIHPDDILTVTACENHELEFYTFEVRSAIGSSNSWTTDLVCEADVKAGT